MANTKTTTKTLNVYITISDTEFVTIKVKEQYNVISVGGVSCVQDNPYFIIEPKQEVPLVTNKGSCVDISTLQRRKYNALEELMESVAKRYEQATTQVIEFKAYAKLVTSLPLRPLTKAHRLCSPDQ